MEQKLTRIPALLITLVLSVTGFFLRSRQLHAPEGGVWLLAIFCAVAVILFAVYARSLRSRKKYGSVSSRELLLLIFSVAASVLMFLSGASLAFKPARQGDMLVAVGAVLTAASWVAVTLARYQGKKAHAALFLIPALFFVVDLICQFRFWTRDPVILDYCFDLFAKICAMFAVFYLGGYAFDQGKRCLTTFFSLGGVLFGAVALAGTTGPGLLSGLAVILWLLGSLWLLLRPGKNR